MNIAEETPERPFALPAFQGSRGRTTSPNALLCAMIILSLSACAYVPEPNKNNSYKEADETYAEKFADIENHQLLLNLARAANDEPEHFVELGSFSAGYSYGSSLSPLGSTSGYTRNAVPAAGVTYSEAPSFNFTPIEGDQATKALFAPMNSAIFSRIFLTWHADTAIRTAVNSITITPSRYLSAASTGVCLTVKGVDQPEKGRYKEEPSDPPSFRVCVSPEAPSVDLNGSTTLTSSYEEAKWMCANGIALKYQWQQSVDGGASWKDVSDTPDASKPDDTIPNPTGTSAGTSPTKPSPGPTTKPSPNGPKDKDKGPAFEGSNTKILTISRATKDLSGSRFRFKVTVVRPAKVPIILFNDPRESTYPYFLALAYELREAQKKGIIPAPYTSNEEKLEADRRIKEAEAGGLTLFNVKLADLVSADAANFSVENAGTGDPDPKTGFLVYKNPDAAASSPVKAFPDKTLVCGLPLMYWIVSNHAKIDVDLRSFDNILYETAKEEQRFLEVKRSNHYESNQSADDEAPRKPKGVRKNLLTMAFDPDCDCKACPEVTAQYQDFQEQGDGLLIRVESNSTTYPFTARPILRLTRYEPNVKVASLPHKRGNRMITYTVGDFVQDADRDSLTDEIEADARIKMAESLRHETPSVSNRTVFTLISFLYNQASIDSSKLPVQQLIQVR